MTDGWCPFARQHRGQAAGPFGYPARTPGQNRPIAFVDHRMAGYKRTLDDDAWRRATGTGVHAGIGRDGSIDQYTSIFDASWGNGVAGSIACYDRGNARLAAIERMGGWTSVSYARQPAYALLHEGVNVINAHTISTEVEDETVDQPWTPAMVETDIRWKRWCLDELAAAGMAMEIGPDMLVGHYQIDAVNRPNCPGDNWPRGEILEAIMGPTKEEFGALFRLVLDEARVTRALGGGLVAVAKAVGAQQADIDAMELALADQRTRLKNIERVLTGGK